MIKKDPVQGGLALWILIHSHKHGDSVMPVLSVEKPDRDEIAASDPDTYELDRDDEFLAVEGPTPLRDLFIRPEVPPGNLAEIRQSLLDKGVKSEDLADMVNMFFATLAQSINAEGFDAQLNMLAITGLIKR